MRAALALIGLTAVIAQVVLLRELLVVFYGNELSLALVLASWLLWTALGSVLLGRLPARSPRLRMAILQVAAAFAFPATIFAVRASRAFFAATPGEVLAPGVMLLVSFAALSVFCLVSGGLFAAGSRLYAAEAAAPTGAATSSVYLLEAAGSTAGGLLASLVLTPHLGAFPIAAILAALNLAVASLLLLRSRTALGAAVVVLGLIFGLLTPAAVRRLEQASLARLWHALRVLDSRNSPYGNLAVVAGEGSRSLYQNGIVQFTIPDPAAAEEAVHYALLQHPAPRRVLLIGGGVNGSAAEVLRHPTVERLDYVELDPAVLDIARLHFARAWSAIGSEERIESHHADGRLFLKTTGERFDVIIVNLPEPQTAQLNRFYTVEFFREAAARLAHGGVLAFQSPGAENYISPELAEFLRCLHLTLRQVFPEVRAIPGDTVHFFAATRPGTLTTSAHELVARLRARNLRTTYVREYFLPFRLAPERLRDLEEQIRPLPGTRLNRDFAPVAYYFDAVLWSTQFTGGRHRWFRALAQVNFLWLAAATALLVLLAIGLAARAPANRRPRVAAGACAAMAGLTLMALQILLLLGFQAIYGYVYQQLALLIAAFMAGLALGSWRALRAGTGGDLRRMVRLQMVTAAAPLLLVVLLMSLAGAASRAAAFFAAQVAIPALALLCGALGGYQFVVASRAFFAGKESGSPGSLYALDLAGACIGALLLSPYLLTVFGFFPTAALLALANTAPATMAWMASRTAAS